MSKSKIIGWVLTALLGAMLILGSARGKFTEWEGKAEMFGQLGWSEETMFRVGIVEVIAAALFIMPPTAFVGAILLTGYLGGAVAAHVRVGEPFFMPVIIGIVVWIALGLRDQRVFRMAFQRSVNPNSPVNQQTESTES